jgi:hypothetical protein
LEKYGFTQDELPALLVVSPDGSTIYTFEGEKFTRRKLTDFLNKHCLKDPVYDPIVKEEKQPTDKENQDKESDPIRTEF